MMGMLIMGVIWTALPLIGNTFATNPEFIASYPGVTDISFVDAITNVFQSGPEGWGSVLVNVVFGAWFGRVLLQTGIADTLIRKTVELGGDRPVIICVLLSTVTTAIFSTLFGAGVVVAIGVIILPILMSLGIPKKLAIGSFMMSVGAGMYLNPVLTGQFLAFFLDDDGKQMITYDDPARLRWAMVGLAVQLIMVIVMCIFALRSKKTVHAWTASAARKSRPGYVPTVALIAPIIPVVLLVVFDIPIILGFTIGSFYALAVCKKLTSFRGACRVMNKDFYDGVVDTAPLVGFLLMIPMFNKAPELCVPYFNALLGNVIPNNTLVISIAFALLAPLGLVKPEYFAYGNANAARKAMKPLADYMGVTVEEAATQILTRAYQKIEPIIMGLAEKYRLEKDQISLVGVGGGAAALIGFCSDKMGLKYSIPDNAEVISSIGVALAMVRDVVERVVPNPTPEDIRSIKAEAIDKAVESGAAADTVDVHIEIDPQTSKLTAIALGSTEVKTTDLLKECTEQEARELAAEDLKEKPEAIDQECATKNFFVFGMDRKGKHPVRILDKKGFIKVQRNDGKAVLTKAGSYRNIVSQLWEELAIYQQDAILRPDYYICAGARVMDFSGSVDLDKIMMLMEVEMQMINPGDDVIIVGAKNSL